MAKSIYVGNLPWSATEEQVQSLFADYGPMEATSPSCNDDKDAGERLTARPMPFLSGGKVFRPKGNRTNRSGFGPFRRTRRDVPVRP